MNALEQRIFDSAVAFTKAYQDNEGQPKEVREAACLAAQYPALFWDIEPGDVFAGNLGKTFSRYVIGIHPQAYGSGITPGVYQQLGYCFNVEEVARLKKVADEEQIKVLDELYEFWKKESTVSKYNDKFKLDYNLRQFMFQRALVDKYWVKKGGGFVAPTTRVHMRFAGNYMNFDKLIQNGVGGLRAMLEPRDSVFAKSALQALDVLVVSIVHYEDQARKMAAQTSDPAQQKNLLEMADTLHHIIDKKPETLRQGIQLLRIYSLICSASCYGRMDEYLGDLYVHDVDTGVLTEQEAEDLVYALFCVLRDTVMESDGRILLGGYGRRNPENADRFALVAMECQKRIHDLIPITTLRLYKGMNPALFHKALDVLSTGALYPTLYNDDEYVPGLMAIMNVPREDAEQYAPLGCGEMVLMGRSHASPNECLNVLKGLEHALYNGYCPVYKTDVSIKTGDPSTFETFEQFVDAVKAHLDEGIKHAAFAHRLEVETAGEEISFLLSSLLFDDCIARDKGIFDGGVRYDMGCTEGFNFTETGDSLYAIRKLIYEDKTLTFDQLKEVLLADFEGYEELRQTMLSFPKYGNDIDEVDELVCEMKDYCNQRAKYWASQVGLDAFLVSNVNPGSYWTGDQTGATPNGRKSGEYCTVGNSPRMGMDHSGLAAMLSSVAKPSNQNGGYITNLKLSKEMFTKHYDTLHSLLTHFFENGGQQLNVTTVDKADLERALVEPEKYQNLIVRLGGWSVRFVQVDRRTQEEIMARTQY